MRLSLKTLAINAAVVLALVGGVTAYLTFDKTVTLSIDGRPQAVHTFADTVGDVLDDRGIELGEHDRVVPSAESEVQDGSEISVRYGRQVTAIVDGEERVLWTTALSVDEALADLGVRDGSDVSVDRSQRIGRDGLDFVVNTPKDLTLVADGEKRPFTTTSLTVRGALRDADIKLRERDQIEPGLEKRLEPGMTVTVRRVTTEQKTVRLAIDHKVTEKASDSLYTGERDVQQEGKDGTIERILEIVYVDGKKTDQRVTSEQVVAKAVTEVILVGTKERPEPEPEPEPAYSEENVDGGVWDRLAECESGGDWSINTGNGYYGGLQFSLSTWQAYGGSGYPHENSKSEQIRIAEKVRDARGGYGDWPACSRKLGLPQ